MFTPPPSPDPRRPLSTSGPARTCSSERLLKLDVADDPFLSPSAGSSRRSSVDSQQPHPAHETPLSPKEDPYLDPYSYALLQKKRTARRIRWTVVCVPLVLVFIALSTRYLTHPAAFDALSSSHPATWSTLQDWTPHKRHAAPEPVPDTTGFATTIANSKPTGSSLSLAPSASAVPTQVDSGNTKVPSAPPVLPTPFPQAFDSTFNTNFQTVACENFMTNMTQTPAFLKCRPFSLLASDSNAFITQSQRNISQLNVIIWGTCNTDLSAEQCAGNMQWFADNIQSACKQDIAANNALVTDAVAGLSAYSVMREAACQVNAQTDTYCYVEAAQSTHPADLYLYELPLGLALPNNTVPSCTTCVKNLMGTFDQDGANVTRLKSTYGPAAATINNACGASFVAEINTTTGNGASALAGAGAGERALGWAAGAGAVVGAALLML
ncbi:hypothetical protein BD309DRAFT_876085 [Dichomitus squalens]|uniref:DUF7729 domain-containing protein n=1 Tax=Dichomitus squalens (strain LYAD-421) TaxID=732165 RepID=R7SV23_DICSQ|nr:uncharacterized protein DICSQDRAFT_88812 [Dichomitus squalens LYAD-421 SS1]EJF59743.1 hypothetical protein DICSQDRAFT_88812 [Dichomitus squalens LYAD-421 SS1]TBU37617.1 hypothetical protein BD309DRAFT_876085 [Dichomitus squalens]